MAPPRPGLPGVTPCSGPAGRSARPSLRRTASPPAGTAGGGRRRAGRLLAAGLRPGSPAAGPAWRRGCSARGRPAGQGLRSGRSPGEGMRSKRPIRSCFADRSGAFRALKCISERAFFPPFHMQVDVLWSGFIPTLFVPRPDYLDREYQVSA